MAPLILGKLKPKLHLALKHRIRLPIPYLNSYHPPDYIRASCEPATGPTPKKAPDVDLESEISTPLGARRRAEEKGFWKGSVEPRIGPPFQRKLSTVSISFIEESLDRYMRQHGPDGYDMLLPTPMLPSATKPTGGLFPASNEQVLSSLGRRTHKKHDSQESRSAQARRSGRDR